MIINERPPNFEAIRIKFPKAEGYGVLTAYDGHIYNPSGIVVPPALIAHEEVHLNRQRDAGPTLWWERYLIDSEFRYHEELLAHVAEYECLAPSHSPDRNVRSALLMHTACRLTAALYAYDPPRTMAHAMKDLRERIKNV
jgi:hypothetical protein